MFDSNNLQQGSFFNYETSNDTWSDIEKSLREILEGDQFILNSKAVESTVTISPYNFTIIKQTFTTDENLFEVIYDDYIKVENQSFPTKIRFINNGLENFNIEIKSILSLDKINIPFRVPKNYKRLDLE